MIRRFLCTYILPVIEGVFFTLHTMYLSRSSMASAVLGIRMEIHTYIHTYLQYKLNANFLRLPSPAPSGPLSQPHLSRHHTHIPHM